MNSTATVRSRARGRWALIAAGIIIALLGSLAATARAQAGYYGGYYGPRPCSYRCGYPAYRYYPPYRSGCYSCGRSVVYERRYVEREYVERRYGYGGYGRCGYYSYGGCRRYYGYYPYGGYGYGRPYGYGYGPGVGRRWPVPFYGYERSGYDEPPRPPAPVWDGGGDY